MGGGGVWDFICIESPISKIMQNVGTREQTSIISLDPELNLRFP